MASSSGSGEKKTSEKVQAGGEEATSSEIVLTPGEKVVVGTRLFFWAGVFAFASVCAYYIGQ
jgi:import inner membrane translocase subunit TIM21